MPSRWYYWDRDKKKMVEGFPPSNIKTYGQAPIVTMGTIKPQYHHGVCRVIDNYKEWDQADKQCGTYTTTKREEVKKRGPSQADIDRDWDKAMGAAIEQHEAGTAPVTDDQKALYKLKNEALSKELGIDASNVFGRKRKRKS